MDDKFACPKCSGELKCVRLADDEFVIKCFGCNTIFKDKEDYDTLWNMMKGKKNGS